MLLVKIIRRLLRFSGFKPNKDGSQIKFSSHVLQQCKRFGFNFNC